VLRGQAGGALRFVDHALLTDGTYTYAVRLDSDEAGRDENRASWRAVVDSIQPLPLPRRLTLGGESPFAHWT